MQHSRISCLAMFLAVCTAGERKVTFCSSNPDIHCRYWALSMRAGVTFRAGGLCEFCV